MTKPRQHLPGQISLMTRRTEERRYFLRPSPRMVRIVEFELAKAAESAGLSVHAFMGMSNHPHIVATDHHGDRSDFMRNLCGGIARAGNHHLGRRGHFWDTSQFGDTVLPGREEIEKYLLYTWLNPVEANLVERAEQWPGPKILPRDWGIPREVEAPKGYYDKRKEQKVSFTPLPPKGYEDMTLEQVKEHFETLLREAEDRLIARRRRSRKRVRGVRWVLAQSPFDPPKSRGQHGTLNPRFATRDAALMERLLQERRQFQADYAEANARWTKGDREVVFPPGTIRHRKLGNATCMAPLGCEASVFRP